MILYNADDDPYEAALREEAEPFAIPPKPEHAFLNLYARRIVRFDGCPKILARHMQWLLNRSKDDEGDSAAAALAYAAAERDGVEMSDDYYLAGLEMVAVQPDNGERTFDDFLEYIQEEIDS